MSKLANELVVLLDNGIATAGATSQFQNEKLQSLTVRLMELVTATKCNMFEIAVHLTTIRDEKLAETAGYKDVFAYAQHVLGWKKNMVYKMIQVASKYIEHNTAGGLSSILAHNDKDYTVSQLIELNPVEVDTARAMNEQGIITPDMTTKAIREAVKEYEGGAMVDDVADDEAMADDSDNATSEGDDVSVACDELNAILEHCEKLLSLHLVMGDVKIAKKITQFKSFAMNCVVNYRKGTADE